MALSDRLIARDTGESVVSEMAEMQTRRLACGGAPRSVPTGLSTRRNLPRIARRDHPEGSRVA